MVFTIEEGMKIAVKQSGFYADQVEAAVGRAQRYAFLEEVGAMIMAGKETAKDGFDIPRGVDIERLAWKYKGKTEKEYSEFLNSLD